MDPGKKSYWFDSLKPIINDVSPETIDRIDTTKWIMRVGLASLLGAMAIFVPEMLDDDDDFNNKTIYYSLLGISIQNKKLDITNK